MQQYIKPSLKQYTYQACKYMDEQYNIIKPKYVKILTDSQSALRALNSIDLATWPHDTEKAAGLALACLPCAQMAYATWAASTYQKVVFFRMFIAVTVSRNDNCCCY